MAATQALVWSRNVSDWLLAEAGARGEALLEVAGWRVHVKVHEGRHVFTWDVSPLDADGAVRFRGLTRTLELACRAACDALERATPLQRSTPLMGKALTGAMEAVLSRGPGRSTRGAKSGT